AAPAVTATSSPRCARRPESPAPRSFSMPTATSRPGWWPASTPRRAPFSSAMWWPRKLCTAANACASARHGANCRPSGSSSTRPTTYRSWRALAPTVPRPGAERPMSALTADQIDDARLTGAWELPEEFRLLRDTVRRFMESEVHPLEEGLPHDAAGLPREQLVALQDKARGLGLWA